MLVVINTENAAFDPDPGPECARLLRQIADIIDGAGTPPGAQEVEPLYDSNGNYCGHVHYSAEEPLE